MLLEVCKAIGWPILRVLFTLEYHGVHNVPATGAVIIAGNHPSYLDPVLVGMAVKRKLSFMAWDAVFKVPLLGSLLRALGAFPVDLRKGKGEAAFNEALNVLRNGHALGIFPEGQRSEKGPMGELRTGVARLALETGAPIVPVTIGGAHRAWPKWKLLPKPAKVVVRFHEPIRIDADEAVSRRTDKEYHREVMGRVAASINRSLTPALRGADSIEKWYRQPPSHIRTYEWAPLIVALVALIVVAHRGSLGENWIRIVAPCALYYAYLIADLSLIEPTRLSKWVRNSMPVWLILLWHYPLTAALGVPAGGRNAWLVAALLGAFFAFFYVDYYTLQKFVRGMVASYYVSLLLLLGWPHALGTLVAVLGFIAIFVLWYKTAHRWWIAGGVVATAAAAIWFGGTAPTILLAYAALSLVMNIYLHTFISAAYDIRSAGNVESRSPPVTDQG